jgi:hypothetical protein
MIPSSISWDIYLDWAVIAVVIYYLLILTICYKKETRVWLKRAGGKSSVFAVRRDAHCGAAPGCPLPLASPKKQRRPRRA